MARPQAKCPIRPGDPCTLCVPGASGPQDCGLVWLVMGDEDLRAELHEKKLARRRAATETAATSTETKDLRHQHA